MLPRMILPTTNKKDESKCLNESITAQKLKFSIKDFFSKCDQIHSFLRNVLDEAQ